ncbi:MAG: hypothetical protein AB1758_35740 [Candidatus Eremiobacterota bacterium]
MRVGVIQEGGEPPASGCGLWLELSPREEDWWGRLIPCPGGYRILAADLDVDRLAGGYHHRYRTQADLIGQAARLEQLTLLHWRGGHPMVAAVAAAELRLGLILELPALPRTFESLMCAAPIARLRVAADPDQARAWERLLGCAVRPAADWPELYREATRS